MTTYVISFGREAPLGRSYCRAADGKAGPAFSPLSKAVPVSGED